jgi:hypothetical protein
MRTEPISDSVRDARSGDITIRFDEDHHAHDITIKVADLDAGNRVTYSSSVECEHRHTVTLTPEIISALNGGATLTVVSNPDACGHAHEWTIRVPPDASELH